MPTAGQSLPRLSEASVVALLLADIHLSHSPPLARSEEPDWYQAMERVLVEVADLANQYSAPILCPGDVFDKANPPPSLINFAIGCLPTMYAVPGQHDLPWHDYGRLKESAYWTLMETGNIINVSPRSPVKLRGLTLHGFPWNKEIEPLEEGDSKRLQVALVHRYLWKKNCGHPHASLDSHLSRMAKKFLGYDIAVIGDNHIPWSGRASAQGCVLFNCGSLMRRSIDQDDHLPSVGLLHADRQVSRLYLDISQDKLLVRTEEMRQGENATERKIAEFVQDLAGLEVESLDYLEAVKSMADKIRKENPAVSKELKELVHACQS